jgi:hypothetical protein
VAHTSPLLACRRRWRIVAVKGCALDIIRRGTGERQQVRGNKRHPAGHRGGDVHVGTGEAPR